MTCKIIRNAHKLSIYSKRGCEAYKIIFGVDTMVLKNIDMDGYNILETGRIVHDYFQGYLLDQFESDESDKSDFDHVTSSNFDQLFTNWLYVHDYLSYLPLFVFSWP